MCCFVRHSNKDVRVLGKTKTESNNYLILITTITFLWIGISGCTRNIIPEESATDQSLMEMTSLQSLPVFKDVSYYQFSSYQRPNEVQPELGSIEQFLTIGTPWFFGWPENYDANHFRCKSDVLIAINSVSIPYRYDQASCEEGYVEGAVLARLEGSGVMSRLWLTQITRLIGIGPSGTIRIYVDDQTTPLYQIDLKELYAGTVSNQMGYPFGAANDMFIVWYYPINFNSKLIVALDQMLIINEPKFSS